jgi:2-polyprenyl-6-methoxyphenol hydroxylase-like FAD-dependent oxidoreductase
VLVVGAGPVGLVAAVELARRGIGVRLVDKSAALPRTLGGHTHLDYGINGDALLIIRPDGYVGMRATDPDEAEIFEYLSQLLPTASGAGVWSFDGEK